MLIDRYTTSENVDELFSLLNFLEPKQFASSEAFLQDFSDLKTEGQVDKLQAVSMCVKVEKNNVL